MFFEFQTESGVYLRSEERCTNSSDSILLFEEDRGEWVGTTIDIIGAYNYNRYGPDNKDHYTVSPQKGSVNLIVGIIGTEGGPPGWTIATLYYGIELTVGWENAIPCYIEMEKVRSTYRDYKMMNYSDYKY